MQKTLKWSVLLTFVAAMIMMFVVPSSFLQSPIITMDVFGDHEASSHSSISMWWSLLLIVPISMLIHSLKKDDDNFNMGIIIISIITFLAMCFSFEQALNTATLSVLIVLACITFLMALPDSNSNNDWSDEFILLIKRLVIAILAVLLTNSLMLGIPNGIFAAVITTGTLIAFGVIITIFYYLFQIVKDLPKNYKLFIKWMNK